MMIDEPNVWSITNKILVIAGSAISLLVAAVATLVILGFNAQNAKISEGDAIINARLTDLQVQHREEANKMNSIIYGLTKDVARIDANQQSRIDREREERRRNGDKEKGR
jgi:hypothetical protein